VLAGSSENTVYFQQVALIGTGLIGGSIGMALRENNLAAHITCYDRDPGAALEAVACGAADAFAETAVLAVKDTDLVILAVPVLSTIEIIKEILPALKEGVLITDVGSTKGSVMAAVEQLLPSFAEYIGGHPMAGSEEAGIKGADPGLLENAIYVLTPGLQTSSATVEKLSAMLEGTGAQPLILDPLSHDRVVALVSHLPHITAATLVQSVAGAGDLELIRTLAAGGFRDSTRIALGNPEVWRDICISNRWALISALKSFRASLDKLEQYLTEPNADAVQEYLLQARDYRKTIPHRGRGILPELFDIIVLVRDTPGVIAKLTGLLGDEGVNIDAIEILHVRELAGGSIRLGFRNREQQQQALKLLKSKGYRTNVKHGE
jgi:prephenate dehydrogenase